MQFNLFSYDICHVLKIQVLYFHVLQFHVLHFHALQFGPSISCPAFSVNPYNALNVGHLRPKLQKKKSDSQSEQKE